jgi:ubiquinone/menaquinone biosynthesis C-methylase UbiE
MAPERNYVPAAGHKFLLPLYDPMSRLFGGRRVLDPLIAQAQLQPRHVVLDVGCGTGTLAIAIKQTYPGVEIFALDPDPPALTRAQRKATRAGVSVRFDRGFAEALEYADGTFDRVFSSLMFHHLGRNERTAMLAEVRRVLKPGGRLEFLDLAGGTHNFLAQLLHGRQVNTAAEDRLLKRMREAGLHDGRRMGTRSTVFGAIAYYQAIAP